MGEREKKELPAAISDCSGTVTCTTASVICRSVWFSFAHWACKLFFFFFRFVRVFFAIYLFIFCSLLTILDIQVNTHIHTNRIQWVHLSSQTHFDWNSATFSQMSKVFETHPSLSKLPPFFFYSVSQYRMASNGRQQMRNTLNIFGIDMMLKSKAAGQIYDITPENRPKPINFQ